MLFTVIAENPAGFVMLPMVKSVTFSSPSVTFMADENDTAAGTEPLLCAVNTYSLTDWFMV